MVEKVKSNDEKSFIKEYPLSPSIAKNLDVLSDILTPEELSLIYVFTQKSHGPKSTRSIRNKYMDIKIMDKEEEFEDFNKNRNTYDEGYIIRMDHYYDEFKKFLGEYLSNECSVSNTKYYAWLEKEIKTMKLFEIPSYDKIDNILSSMMELGIFAQRNDPRKNAKYLWFLNPEFSLLWNKRNPDCIEKRDESRDKALVI